MPLVIGEFARRLQDGVRDGDPADVVQCRSAPQVGKVAVIEAKLPTNLHGEHRDVVDVLAQCTVVLAHDAQQDLMRRFFAARPAAALVGVHALLGGAQRLGRVDVLCVEDHTPRSIRRGRARRAR